MFELDNPECSFCNDDSREIIEKFLTICLPITVTPCVEIKPVKTETCGRPIIIPTHATCYNPENEGCCEFTIVQKMKIEIPVEFNARTKIDDPFVDCEFCKDKEDK